MNASLPSRMSREHFCPSLQPLLSFSSAHSSVSGLQIIPFGPLAHTSSPFLQSSSDWHFTPFGLVLVEVYVVLVVVMDVVVEVGLVFRVVFVQPFSSDLSMQSASPLHP